LHNGEFYNLDSSPSDIRDKKSRYTNWSEKQTRIELTKKILKILILKNEENVHLEELSVNGKRNVLIRLAV